MSLLEELFEELAFCLTTLLETGHFTKKLFFEWLKQLIQTACSNN